MIGMHAGPATVIRCRSPARAGGRPGSGSPANGFCGTKLWQNVPVPLCVRIPDSRFHPAP